MSMYQEDDHQRLTTDPTIYTPPSDGCLFGFLPYRMGIAPAFRRDDNHQSSSPCLTGTFSDHGGAATPTTAGPAAATTAATEPSRDATDNWNTDLNAAAVEEAALGAAPAPRDCHTIC